MAHPYHHALSSVKKYGGKVEDYLAIHEWFDESKMIVADFRYRALRHRGRYLSGRNNLCHDHHHLHWACHPQPLLSCRALYLLLGNAQCVVLARISPPSHCGIDLYRQLHFESLPTPLHSFHSKNTHPEILFRLLNKRSHALAPFLASSVQRKPGLNRAVTVHWYSSFCPLLGTASGVNPTPCTCTPSAFFRNHQNNFVFERSLRLAETRERNFVPLNKAVAWFGSSRHSPEKGAQAQGRKRKIYMNLNQLTIIGFCGANAETKYVPNGTPVTKFSVATKKSWKDENDQWKEKTQWHNVVAFGKGFAQLADRLVKGAHVFVRGELTAREYDRTIRVPISKRQKHGARHPAARGGTQGRYDPDTRSLRLRQRAKRCRRTSRRGGSTVGAKAPFRLRCHLA
jgi:primosomal replication protein N